MDWNRCSRDEVVSWLRVALVPGVPPAALRELLKACGQPQALLQAPRRRIESLAGPEVGRALAAGPDPVLLEATLRWLDADDHHLVALDDSRYPRALLEVHNPPPILYVAGKPEMLSAPALAIVGSRNATAQGVRDAEAFARAVSAAGLAIVSGLALGIDAAAHRGGLSEAGSSMAVLGTGPDIVYPAANRELARALERGGCLVSEFPLGSTPQPGNFPRRNRLISGLSKGVLVIEAALASGSLTTARLALEQGRDVFAMPGSIHAPQSKGCHWLIQQGAKLVERAEDVLEEIAWKPVAAANAVPPPRPERDPVLEAMGFAPVSLDQIARCTGLDMARLAGRISQLEIEGRVAALAGGLFQRIVAVP